MALLVAFNTTYGFSVETRGKRQITGLFGQYVPPELVDDRRWPQHRSHERREHGIPHPVGLYCRGDAVNLASRLESITKQYGAIMIVGEETRNAASDVVFCEPRAAWTGMAAGLSTPNRR